MGKMMNLFSLLQARGGAPSSSSAAAASPSSATRLGVGMLGGMGKVMNTTIFVANGPCTAGLGVEGEGYPSFSIATPSGEGITTPLTFTRFRRCSVSHSLRIV